MDLKVFNFMLLLSFLQMGKIKTNTVRLTSPNLIHGIHYPNGSSNNPWTTSGGRLHSTPQSSGTDSYHVLLHMTASPAKEIAIDVTYTLICCSYDRRIGLYVLGTSGSIAIPPSPMQRSFRHITDLTNTRVMGKSGSMKFTTRSYVAVTNTQLYIAFRSRGFYGTIEDIKIYYFKCPAMVANLVSYPEKIAPERESVALTVSGTCVHQSLPKTTPLENVMICYPNGTSKIMGGCQCIAGYQNTSVSSCSVCPPKTFKAFRGNFNCSICGSNVLDGTLPRTEICQCIPGFYRPMAYLNAHQVDCEEPPSEPIGLKVKATTSKSASLTWEKPIKTGTGAEIWYLVRYGTKSYKTNVPRITINGLTPFTVHNITITSESSVTEAIGISRIASISFTTREGLPSMVRELRYEEHKNESVTVYWKEPAVKGSKDVSYAISTKKLPLKFLNVTQFTLLPEDSTTSFNVTVRSYNVIGFSEAQTITIPRKKQVSGPTTLVADDKDQIPVTTISVVVPIVLVLLLALSYSVYRCKRRGNEEEEEQQIRLEQVLAGSYNEANENAAIENDENNVDGEENVYQEIDDSQPNPPAPVREEYQSLIAVEAAASTGSTEYAKLHIALPKHLEKEVRAHLVCTYEKNEVDQKLANQLKEFHHQNVLSFTKIIQHDNSELALFEKVEHGQLDKYLQEKEMKEEYTIELLRMALGVAEGMRYLSGKNYVHKYLKAENILVASDGTCKIFGFNLRKKGPPTCPYRTPQVDLSQEQLTTKSDVWSYGVLLWEIMSYGKAPELTEAKDEYILEKPEYCDQELYELMTSCWKKEPSDRPTFEFICTQIRDKINWLVNKLRSRPPN